MFFQGVDPSSVKDSDYIAQLIRWLSLDQPRSAALIWNMQRSRTSSVCGLNLEASHRTSSFRMLQTYRLLSTQLPAGYIEQLAHFAWDSNSTLVVGVPWTTGPGIYLNSVIGFSFGQSTLYRYDKHHLVPFGEFIPAGARWFVDLMKMPLGDFGRGALYQPPIDVREQWVLPNICYEDLFGEEIAAQIAAAIDRGSPVPSILLNVSNIAWFGDTIALPQHLQISQMRALETGRPMLRATNTGATAVIDGRGQITAQLPAFTRGTLETSVQGMQGTTPYIWLGNTLPIGLALALLALPGLKRFGRSKNS